MAAKSVILLTINAFFVQAISGACWGNSFNSVWPGWAGEGGWSGPGLAEGPILEAGPAGGIAAGLSGFGLGGAPRGFAVSSASPIPPVGMSVASDNAIEGILAIGGELPFLGTVELEGALPTAGEGVVSYGCGDGVVGIVAEDIAPIATGLPGPGFGYGPNWAGGLGWAGRGMAPYGCGCGGPY